MRLTIHPAVIEATRLTRDGRLVEATELIQRMLHSWKNADVKTGGAAAGDPPFGTTSVIDITPDMIEPPNGRRSMGTGCVRPDAEDSLAANTSGVFQPRITGQLPDLLKNFSGVGENFSEVPRSSPLSPENGPDVLPQGGEFLTTTYTGHGGTRDYKLYIPRTYRGQPLPLVVMLHGCTQSAEDFAAGTRMNMVAEERACFLAYPVQPKSANGSKCWNWFNPRDQQRDRGEPSLIAGITGQISRNYAIDPRRIYVAGLSAGGAAAAIMGATYPDIYAAVGVHSGLECGAASDLPSAFSAMRQGSAAANRSPRSFGFHGRNRLVPTIVFHGEKDATVHPRNGDHVIEQVRSAGLAELRSVTQRGHVPGGHAYSRTNHFDPSGRVMLEMWVVHGAGHAWSGGSPAGSFTDPLGPDASREMIRFFLEHQHPHPSKHSN